METRNDTYCVYIHTNKINGKKYIGQTINGEDPNKRWKNGFGYEHQKYFYNAIQKYGWDNFDHEVVASNLTKEQADNIEKRLIKEFDTKNRDCGYNLTDGGDGATGVYYTEEMRHNISVAQKNRFSKSGKDGHPMYGKKHSDEAKEKVSIALKKNWSDENYRKHMSEVHMGKMTGSKNPRARKVAQYTKEGEFIRYWDCIQDACNELDIRQPHISRCCIGDRKTAYGFVWKYADEEKGRLIMDEFKSFFKTVSNGNEGEKCRYNTRLDVYGKGCQHNCDFCYARSLLDFRKLWDHENPAVADIEKVKRKIAKLPKDTQPLRLGGMSDMFAPIEKEMRMTYETIKCLNEHRIPYLIVTKGAMVADDEYIELMDKELAHIQISITTTDDEFCKTYEHASAPSKRIKAIEKLHEHGFDVSLRLSPFIPEYIDFDIINNVKCDKILVEFLRVNTWIRKWFDLDYSEYTVKQSGYNHLPLEKKKEYISKITGFKEMTVCEDEDEAYEYWRNNFNHNPNDCCNLRIAT